MRVILSVFLSILCLVAPVVAQPVVPQPVQPVNVNAGSTERLNILIGYLQQRYDVAGEAVAREGANAVNESRNDQQLGAVPGAAGSTTLAEKAGLPDLIAIAIERGAITKKNDDDSVTLTTTPYAWLTAFGLRDSTENWEAYRWARRIGISSTFASDVTTSGDFSTISAAEMKVIAYGNRSARDMNAADFRVAVADVNARLAAADHAQVRQCFRPLQTVIGTPAFVAAFTALPQSLSGDLQNLDAVFASVDSDSRRKETLIALVRTCAETVELQRAAEAAVEGRLSEIATTYLAQANRFQLSFAGLFQRDAETSDFYSLKILSDWNLSNANADGEASVPTANLNVQVDFNSDQHDPQGKELDSVRAFSSELAASTAKRANGRYDASLSAKVSRPKGDDAKTSAIAQAKVNVYVIKGFAVPIALSYANRATDTIKKGFQVSVGISGLLDRLLSNEFAR